MFSGWKRLFGFHFSPSSSSPLRLFHGFLCTPCVMHTGPVSVPPESRILLQLFMASVYCLRPMEALVCLSNLSFRNIKNLKEERNKISESSIIANPPILHHFILCTSTGSDSICNQPQQLVLTPVEFSEERVILLFPGWHNSFTPPKTVEFRPFCPVHCYHPRI